VEYKAGRDKVLAGHNGDKGELLCHDALPDFIPPPRGSKFKLFGRWGLQDAQNSDFKCVRDFCRQSGEVSLTGNPKEVTNGVCPPENSCRLEGKCQKETGNCKAIFKDNGVACKFSLTMGGAKASVGVCLEGQCESVAYCPSDAEWVKTKMDTTREIPCPNRHGMRRRKCTGGKTDAGGLSAAWEEPDLSECHELRCPAKDYEMKGIKHEIPETKVGSVAEVECKEPYWGKIITTCMQGAFDAKWANVQPYCILQKCLPDDAAISSGVTISWLETQGGATASIPCPEGTTAAAGGHLKRHCKIAIGPGEEDKEVKPPEYKDAKWEDADDTQCKKVDSNADVSTFCAGGAARGCMDECAPVCQQVFAQASHGGFDCGKYESKEQYHCTTNTEFCWPDEKAGHNNACQTDPQTCYEFKCYHVCTSTRKNQVVPAHLWTKPLKSYNSKCHKSGVWG